MSIREFKDITNLPDNFNNKINEVNNIINNKHNITIRCGNCGEFEPDNGKSVLLDFKEQEIYYHCSKCNKDNIIKLKAHKPAALPRIRTGRS